MDLNSFLRNNTCLFDNDVNTCRSGKRSPYKLRFPWPTSNTDKLEVTVKIDGKNLNCASYESNGFANKIMVYVPLDFQVQSNFKGNFMGCYLRIRKLNSFEYDCNCRGKICQAR